MTADGVIEIRPVRPDGKLNPQESATLRDWRLTADPAAGTLTLAGDKTVFSGGKPKIFALPSSGRAEAVTTVCLATHNWVIGARSGATWRLLFLDRDNRMVGAGIARDHPRVLRLLRPEVFAPLEAAGLRVVSEFYNSTRALEEAHPGAAGKVEATGANRGKTAAIGLGAAAVIVIVIVVIVYLTSH